MHPSEVFAGQVLRLNRPPIRSEIQHLFDLLPKERPPRGDASGRAFACGMYCQGPLQGLRANSRRHPLSSKLLASFVRSLEPSFHFSSLHLFLNVRTSTHIDSNNAPLPNLIAGISDFKDGQVLVESLSLQLRRRRDPLPAIALEVAGTFATFDAYRLRHQTAAWQGDRLVLVAFSVKNIDRLEQGDLSILHEQNFNPCLDVLCSTDAPPIATGSLSHCLPHNAASRMCGRSFASLLFVEIFCGTGGLSAVLKRSGIGHVLGITSRVTGNTQCSVLPLDLHNDSQHPLLWDVLERENLCGVHLSPPSRDEDMCQLAAKVLKMCHSRGVLVSVAGSSSSRAWGGPLGKTCLALGFLKTSLHQCMFGDSHAKHSTFFHNFPELRSLGLCCDGHHTHAPWDPSTAPTGAYPTALCHAYARALLSRLSLLGCDEPSREDISLNRAAQVASSKQPRGSRIPLWLSLLKEPLFFEELVRSCLQRVC